MYIYVYKTQISEPSTIRASDVIKINDMKHLYDIYLCEDSSAFLLLTDNKLG